MGYLLHRPIEIVSAIRSEKSNGYTNFRKSPVDWLDPAVTLTRHGQRWLWDYTTIALAGTLTQTFRYPDTPRGSALPDYRMAKKLSLRACCGNMERAIAYGSKAMYRVADFQKHDRYWTLSLSSSDLAGLKDVDGFGQLPGLPGAAAEFAQDAPGLELCVGAFARAA